MKIFNDLDDIEEDLMKKGFDIVDQSLAAIVEKRDQALDGATSGARAGGRP